MLTNVPVIIQGEGHINRLEVPIKHEWTPLFIRWIEVGELPFWIIPDMSCLFTVFSKTDGIEDVRESFLIEILERIQSSVEVGHIVKFLYERDVLLGCSESSSHTRRRSIDSCLAKDVDCNFLYNLIHSKVKLERWILVDEIREFLPNGIAQERGNCRITPYSSTPEPDEGRTVMLFTEVWDWATRASRRLRLESVVAR